jgi:hypothetical protein
MPETMTKAKSIQYGYVQMPVIIFLLFITGLTELFSAETNKGRDVTDESWKSTLSGNNVLCRVHADRPMWDASLTNSNLAL